MVYERLSYISIMVYGCVDCFICFKESWKVSYKYYQI